MQQEYAREAGALAEPDPAKDANEAQLAAFIGRIGGYIDRLKQAASTAQGQGQAPGGGGGAAGGARVNEHTAAHMHGVVLILAERLHRATRAFDRLRAARYQAMVEQRPPGAPPLSSAAAGSGGPRPGGSSGSAMAAAGAGTGAGGAGNGAGKQAGGLGSALTAAARNGWQHILGVQVSGPKGHEHEHDPDSSRARDDAAAAAAAAGPGDGGGGAAGSWQVQEVELENRALLERLTAKRDAVLGVEQAVRDVAALNQMFSSAVLAQAETIESIYLAAVDATHNISAGNVSLRKTVEVNRSTTRYILVLLLVATVCLLFFDWFSS